MSITGTEPGDPTKVGVAMVDVLTGMHAITGILVALAHRDRTGQGQRVDTDLLSVLLSSMVNQASGFLGAGSVPTMMGNRHPSIAPYQTFNTADRPIALAVGNDKQFRLLVTALGLDALADDERLHPRTRYACVTEMSCCALLEAEFSNHGADYWYGVLTAVGGAGRADQRHGRGRSPSPRSWAWPRPSRCPAAAPPRSPIRCRCRRRRCSTAVHRPDWRAPARRPRRRHGLSSATTLSSRATGSAFGSAGSVCGRSPSGSAKAR